MEKGTGECTAEDVVRSRTEKKKKKGGEEEYNASARHKERGMLQPGVTQCVWRRRLHKLPVISS